MVKAIYFHAIRLIRWPPPADHEEDWFRFIRPSRLMRIVNFCHFMAVLLLLGTGCSPSQQAITPGEPPLRSLPGNGKLADPGQTGLQAASLQLTQEGREHLRSGRLDEAMSRFQKAISLSATNPYAYYYLGETRYLRQEYHQSLSLLERAELLLLSDPIWLSRVHVLRGKNYEALYHLEEARGQYQQALAEDPRNPEAQEAFERLKNPAGRQ